jgi:hypothetical protein
MDHWRGAAYARRARVPLGYKALDSSRSSGSHRVDNSFGSQSTSTPTPMRGDRGQDTTVAVVEAFWRLAVADPLFVVVWAVLTVASGGFWVGVGWLVMRI